MAIEGAKVTEDWVIETFNNDEEALDAVDNGTVVGTKRCFIHFSFYLFVSTWNLCMLINENT